MKTTRENMADYFARLQYLQKQVGFDSHRSMNITVYGDRIDANYQEWWYGRCTKSLNLSVSESCNQTDNECAVSCFTTNVTTLISA